MGKINIIGPGYVGRSANVNTSRCINFYPELKSPDSKDVAALIGTPGLSLFSNTNLNPIRGLHVFNGLLYLIAADKLYSIDGSGILSAQLGNSLVTNKGRVQMADNGLAPTGGNQLVIVDGSNIYVWDVSTSTFTTVGITANTICFLGGYFIADIGGGQWQRSNLYDGTTWNALNKSTADAAPDNLLSVFNNHGELWLFGEYTTEIWYHSGSGTLYFARMSGGVVDYGVAARHSIAKGSNTLFWLATKKNNNQGQFAGVCMAAGYNARIISPPSINWQINQYTTIDDAFGYCYSEEGHEFYVLTFPSANATWVYDSTTNLWHERSSYKDDPYKVGRHLGNCYAHYNAKHYVGDYETGNIYEMSSAYYTDAGEPIASVRIMPHLSDKQNLKNFFIHKLQIDAETGIGDGSADVALNGITSIDTAAFPRHIYDDGTYIWVTSTSGVVVKINPLTDITTNITVGSIPADIVSDGTNIWVANYASNTVSKIDPSTDTVTATVTVGTNPTELLFDGTYIWVANRNSDNVMKINPSTNLVEATITVGDYPRGFAFDDDYIWVINNTSNNVSKINRSTDIVDATISVGTSPDEIIFDGNYVWVTNNGSNNLSKINPSTDVVDATITVGSGPTALTYDDNYIWVTNSGTTTISKIDRTTDIVEATITVGTAPDDIVSDGTYIWVMNTTSGNVSKVDPVNDTELLTIDVGSMPESLLYDDTYIWVAGYNSNTVRKIQPYIESSSNNPQAMLSWSNDGGHTWSNEKWASIGKQGEYKTRLIWRRLGKSRDRVFRIAISAAIKKVLIAAHIESTGGTS